MSVTPNKKTTRTPLDPPDEQMRQAGYAVIDRIVDHISSLSDQRVAKRGGSADYEKLVDESLPIEPADVGDCVDFYFDRVVPLMTRVNHPRFHGFIPCPSSFVGMLGMTLAAGTNPFVGSWLGGATVASLELTVLRWIKELLALDPGCEGILTSGGSMANLIGLASARAKYGRSVLENGVIYVSAEGHASVDKAALVLGFKQENIRHIRTDREFKLDLDDLNNKIVSDRGQGLVPFFVSSNAGTTNTGSIDDLREIAKQCRRESLWFHVDAAYGGFAAMVPEVRTQMDGLEEADSITLDPHKWLYCPMGIGCAFVKQKQHMESAFSTHGSYLQDLTSDEVNFLDRGPELSRPARVLPVWMLLRSAGRNQIIDQIRTDIEFAKLAASLLGEDERFEVCPVRLSIVTFRHRIRNGETEQQRAMRDEALMEATLSDGELMLSSTKLGGINTLRLVVMNHRTTRSDVIRTVKRIRELSV